MTCIECPVGCQLEVDEDGGRLIKLTGNKCEKGVDYARQEIENPTRILTTTVLTRGLPIKMVPVRTSVPIPTAKLMEAMAQVKKLRLDRPVKANEVVIPNFLGAGADLIATRTVS
jgi:CxxC motif-containing protein